MARVAHVRLRTWTPAACVEGCADLRHTPDVVWQLRVDLGHNVVVVYRHLERHNLPCSMDSLVCPRRALELHGLRHVKPLAAGSNNTQPAR